jgi:TonB-dependent SusC/RagA subfamily outer membrane receptor
MRKALLLVLLLLIKFFALAGDTIPTGNPGCHAVLRCARSVPSNEPLIVIDGMIADTAALNKLIASNILKIDVLKDSATTIIYGDRAVNGVILIATKKKGHLIVQDAVTTTLLEGASVKILPDKKHKEPILLAADKNGEIDLTWLKQRQEYKMEVSCIGYKNKTAKISLKEQYPSIQLERNYQPMANVMVIAYPTIRRYCGGCICSVVLSNPGINHNANSSLPSFSVYPNPVVTSGAITITLSQPMEGRADIISSTGQVLQSINLKNDKTLLTAIHLNAPSAGIYFVRITNSKTQKLVTQKLIVE